MSLVEREINNFKFILLGEEYLKRMKLGENNEEFLKELKSFINKYRMEADFKDNAINRIYNKLTEEFKVTALKEFF